MSRERELLERALCALLVYRERDGGVWYPLCDDIRAFLATPAPVTPETLVALSPHQAGRSHRILHALWTKAVGTPGYDKAEWQELEAAIVELRECTSEPPP